MSERYPGGIISQTAPVPSGPFQNNTAPGIWTLEQQAYWARLGQWPTAGNVPIYIEDVFSTYLYTGNGSTQTITNGIQLGDSSVIASQSNTALPTSSNRNYQYVAAGNGIFVASAYQAGGSFTANYYATSTDGITWTNQTSLPVTALWLGLAFGNGVFVMTTQDSGGSNTTAYSSDGLSWSTASGIPTNYSSSSVWFTNGQFFSTNANVSGFGQTIYRSTDGISWSSVSVNAGASSQYQIMQYGAGIYILTGNADTVYSSNLSSWSVNGVGVLNNIAYGNGKFVARTQSNALVTSTDGINWTTVQASGFTINYITFNGSLFLGSGSSGQIYWSSDGTTWNSDLSASTFQMRNATLSGKTVFVGIGNGARSAVVVDSFTPATLGKGGLVWIKSRSAATDNFLFDTTRGALKEINSNNQNAETSLANSLTAFNNNGFNLGNAAGINVNAATYCSWTFEKLPKFFDIVTYTGDGSSNRQIAHNLGSAPGIMILKRLSPFGNAGAVYHRSLGATKVLFLELTDAALTSSSYWNNTEPTSTEFTVSNFVNGSGQTWVAYLFAHNAGGFGDAGTDNVISCGSFTGLATVDLGYEPQWILYKTSGSANSGWLMVDNMRGFTAAGSADPYLEANSSAAEQGGNDLLTITSTGFKNNLFAGDTFIYMAIRRGPMRTPTVGTSVYQANAYTGNATTDTTVAGNFGFPVDLMLLSSRTANALGWTSYAQITFDRLRGVDPSLGTALISSEVTGWTGYHAFDVRNSIGWGLYGTSSGSGYLNNSDGTWVARGFQRAPGFFDIVCYSGTSATQNIPHNLGVKPELWITKRRNGTDFWPVWVNGFETYEYMNLGATGGKISDGPSNQSFISTSTQLTIQTSYPSVNQSGGTYVAYLFATVAGVSKVGSYTGTGSTQTINAGLPTGARFVLIKRTDSTGSWWTWDTARGMVAGTDPRLALNSTAAEINNDWVYTVANGFQIVTSDATVNASGSSYIYLAIA